LFNNIGLRKINCRADSYQNWNKADSEDDRVASAAIPSPVIEKYAHTRQWKYFRAQHLQILAIGAASGSS
jgi:hypothetical protein